MKYRTATPEDLPKLIRLYKEVTRTSVGSTIARKEEEVTPEFVQNFLTKSLGAGLIIVAEHPQDPAELIAEIHAYNQGIHIFSHVLSNLTIVVHPDFQGKKIGRTIFTIFLEEVALNQPQIGKVELFVRESNLKAMRLYQSLGFQIEGRMEMRIKTPENTYEADIPMGWQNPNFEFDLTTNNDEDPDH